MRSRHRFRAALQLCPLGCPPVHPGKTTRHPITSWRLRFCMYKPGPGSLPRKVPAMLCGVGDTLPHSPSATADTSSCSARISLASLVRYWQRRSSCCSTVAMRRERVCRQFITDGSALACGRGTWDSNAARVLRQHTGTADARHGGTLSAPFPHSPLQVPPLSPVLCPL